MHTTDIWTFGYVSILLAFVLPLLYLILRLTRKFSSWALQEEAPKERKVVYVPVLALGGFLLGGLLQQFVEMGVNCFQNNERIVACFVSDILPF